MRNPTVNEIELTNFVASAQQPGSFGWVEEGLGVAQLGFFSIVFSFFTTPAGKAFLMERHLVNNAALQIFLFPIAAALEIADAAAAGVKLGTANNKNMEKTMNFVSKAIKAGIIVPAVVIGAVSALMGLTALGAVVPYLFVTALGINTIYHFSKAIYHVVKMYKAPEGSALRAAHKKQLISSVINTVIGVAMVGVIAGLFAAGVSTPIGLAVLAGIGVVTVVTAVAVHLGMKYYAKRQAEQAAKHKPVAVYKEPLLSADTFREVLISTALKRSVSNGDIEAETKAAGDENDRLYVRNLVSLLNTADKEGPEVLKETFNDIISAKIVKLRQQIDDANEKSKKIFSFFTNQKPKRQMKIRGLDALKIVIADFNGSAPLDAEKIAKIIEDYPGIFQSFKHDKSDVELIFDAAKEYFIKRVPQIEEDTEDKIVLSSSFK